MARVYDEAKILLLVFNHHKKLKTIFFFAKFALRECLVRNTEVNTFVLGHQHGEIVLPWLVGTKHFPESKNTFQNPKHLLPWDVFLDSGKCFGFWEVFCPDEPRYLRNANKTKKQILVPLLLERIRSSVLI